MEREIVPVENVPIEAIKDRIYLIRGQRVMLDRDLSELYDVTTGRLNEAVKRNIERFPEDFMFRLDKDEWTRLKSQIAISNKKVDAMKSQIAISNRGGDRALPYAFTELGIAMLSSVLRSSIAIQVNINIMRAFVAIRNAMSAMQATDMKLEKLSMKVDQLNARVDDILHDQSATNMEVAIQIAALNDALDKMREKPASPRKRIGYKTSTE